MSLYDHSQPLGHSATSLVSDLAPIFMLRTKLTESVPVTFTLPKASPTIIVLGQLDRRYFNDISGWVEYSLDFKLYKRGEKKVIAYSKHALFWGRSVNAEVDLEAGEYVVHVSMRTQMQFDLCDEFTLRQVRIDRSPIRQRVSSLPCDMACA
jgi:hypothetical protein